MTATPDVPRLDYAPAPRRVSPLHRWLLTFATVSALTGAFLTSRWMELRNEAAIAAQLARNQTARASVEKLGVALDAFKNDTGRYPSAEEGLAALVNRPPGVARWTGPYVASPVQLSDPWGRPYFYYAPGQIIGGGSGVISLGPDGKKGTPDDVMAWPN